MTFYKGKIENIEKGKEIFVFGSNPEGRHGAGAAKIALKYGAKYYQGRGLQGSTYALPTKNLKAGYTEKATGITYEKAGKNSISLEQIKENIKELYVVAKNNPQLTFKIVYTNDNNNLNGYSSNEIFDTFIRDIDIPENISFSDTFIPQYKEYLKEKSKTKTSMKKLNIEIVNISKNKKVKEEKNYVYCGRGSALGNPFAMKNYTKEERDRVCDEYEIYIEKEIKTNQKIKNQLNIIWNIARKEGSVKLGCFCAPQRCHCETIQKILENKFQEIKDKKNKKQNNRGM
jgi:hypothetical protein